MGWGMGAVLKQAGGSTGNMRYTRKEWHRIKAALSARYKTQERSGR